MAPVQNSLSHTGFTQALRTSIPEVPLASLEKTLGVEERPNTWERAEYRPRSVYLKVAIFTCKKMIKKFNIELRTKAWVASDLFEKLSDQIFFAHSKTTLKMQSC